MKLLDFANNAVAELAEPLEADGTLIILSAGQGAQFPIPDSGTEFIATLSQPLSPLNEVVLVTARSGDELTVTRAQEGTIAQEWGIGTEFEALVTAGTMDRFPQIPQAQSQSYNYSVATSAVVNAYVAAFTPGLSAPFPGMPVTFKVPSENTGPATFNGWGVDVPIRRRDGSALLGGELITGMVAELKWNGALLLLQGISPADIDTTPDDDGESAVTPRYLGFKLAQFAAIGAACAIALYSDGTHDQSLPIVSRESYQIRQVLDIGGKTAIRLGQKPVAPPTNLAVRMDCAIHGETYGAHQADGNWNNISAGPDPFTFVLNDCPWVDSPDSVFVIGHCYQIGSLMPDCSAEINRLLQAGMTKGGTTHVVAPPGGKYQKNATIRFVSSTVLDLGGSAASFIFLADKVDQPGADPDGGGGVAHMLGCGVNGQFPNVYHVTVKGAYLHANRTRCGYLKGQHAIDFGGDSDVGVRLEWIKIIDIYVAGAPGYGASLGGFNGKAYIFWDGGGVLGSDGDAEDIKNRLSVNTTVWNTNMVFNYWALGGQGTNLSWNNLNGANTNGEFYSLLTGAGSVNPVRVYSGQTFGTMSKHVLTIDSLGRIQKPLLNISSGERLCLRGVTAFGGIDFSGQFFNVIGVYAYDYDINPTGSSYNSLDGTVTLKATTNLDNFDVGDAFVVSATGTGADIGLVNGAHTILTKPTADTVTYVIATGKTITSITGGSVSVNDLIKFDLRGQTATSNSNGGGSAIEVFNANLSTGDRIIDMRGLDFKAEGCTATGWYNRRSGWNQRFGSGVAENQQGGIGCQIIACSGFDTSPLWIKDLEDIGAKCRGSINLTGIGARAIGNTFVTRIGGLGIDLESTSRDAYVSGNIIKGCDVGIHNKGQNNTAIGNQYVNCLTTAISDNGGPVVFVVPGIENPFTPTQLNGTTVQFTGSAPASFNVGDRVRFSGQTNINNGIFVRPSNQGNSYPIASIIDQFRLTFVADGSSGATSLAPFGGIAVDCRTQGTDTPTLRNSYVSEKIIFEDDVVPGTSFRYAVDVGNSFDGNTGLSEKASFFNIMIDDVVPAAQRTRDNGTGTIWAGGSPVGEVPQIVNVDVLNAPAIIGRRGIGPLVTPGRQTFIVPFADSRAQVTNLGYFATLIVTATALTHSSVASHNWGLVLSDDNGVSWKNSGYHRIGFAGGTANFLFAGSSSGATQVGLEMLIYNFNQPYTTFARIKGGQKDSVTAIANGPGYYEGTNVFNAISVLASGNVLTGYLTVQGIPFSEI